MAPNDPFPASLHVPFGPAELADPLAVGVLHLSGQQGLLRLLTDAGYRISPVY